MKKFIATFVFASLFSNANAQQSCADYPYGAGIVDITTASGITKLLATAGVGVAKDDIDWINDARVEATLKAKMMIASWLEESGSLDLKIERVINASSQTDGQSVKIDRAELKKQVESFRNSATATLRGVTPLGSCYTKGRELRVTVGIKLPEMVKTEGVPPSPSDSSTSSESTLPIGPSISKTNKNSENSTNAGAQTLRSMDGHSDSSRINRF